MEKSIIEVILQYGGLGAVLIVVGWAYFKKDKAIAAAGDRLALEQQKRIDDAKSYREILHDEQEMRISDAKEFHALAMELQANVITAVNKLSDIVEAFERREYAREQRDGQREMRTDSRGSPYRDLPKGPVR